jgi:O-antigen ligase
MVSIAVTGSRGGTVALLSGLMTLGALNLRRWPWFVGLLLIAAVIAPFLPAYYWERVADIGAQAVETVDVGEAFLTDRGQLNRAAIQMWQDHPFLGVGAGQYIVHLGLTRYNPGFKPGIELTAHNLYLEALSENGILGFAVLMTMILLAAFRISRTWSGACRARDDDLRQLAAVVAAILAAFLAFGMTGSLLYQKPIHMIFAFAVCVASVNGAPWFRGDDKHGE